MNAAQSSCSTAHDDVLERNCGGPVRPAKLLTFTSFDAEAAARSGTSRPTTARPRASASLTSLPRSALIPAPPWSRTAMPRLAAILAAAVVPISTVIADVSGFDPKSDADYLKHLYVPGLRRAGGLDTAASASAAAIVVHGAGDRFTLKNARVVRDRLDAPAVAAALHAPSR